MGDCVGPLIDVPRVVNAGTLVGPAFVVDVPDVVKDNIVVGAVYEGQKLEGFKWTANNILKLLWESSNLVSFVFFMYVPMCIYLYAVNSIVVDVKIRLGLELDQGYIL